MNRAHLNAINERVAPTDDLYILGDFSYQMTAVEAAALRSKINCRKVHIVPGNHRTRTSAMPTCCISPIARLAISRI